MSNNSLAFNTRICQQFLKSRKHLLCKAVSKCQLLFEHVCRVSQGKDICAKPLQRSIKLVQISKYIPGPNYASLLTHISFKRNSANGEFLFLKNCFVSHLTSTRCGLTLYLLADILLPYGEDVQTTRPYFLTVLKSGVQDTTSNFINSFHHVI